jgi:hypothetical protein
MFDTLARIFLYHLHSLTHSNTPTHAVHANIQTNIISQYFTHKFENLHPCIHASIFLFLLHTFNHIHVCIYTHPFFHAEHDRYFATEAEIVTPRAFEVSPYRQALLLQDRT